MESAKTPTGNCGKWRMRLAAEVDTPLVIDVRMRNTSVVTGLASVGFRTDRALVEAIAWKDMNIELDYFDGKLRDSVCERERERGKKDWESVSESLSLRKERLRGFFKIINTRLKINQKIYESFHCYLLVHNVIPEKVKRPPDIFFSKCMTQKT